MDGNNLMCEGARELIKLCVEQAEYEVYLKAEEAKKKALEEEALKTAGNHSMAVVQIRGVIGDNLKISFLIFQ